MDTSSERKELDQLQAECALLRSRLENVRQCIEPSLSSILGMTSLLLDSGLSGEQLEYTQVLRRSADSISAVLTEIQDAASNDEQSDLRPHNFDLHLLIDDTLDLYRAQAWQKNLELTVQFEGDIPPQVQGVPGQVRRVLSELLRRAFMAQAGHVAVRVHGLATDRQIEVRMGVTSGVVTGSDVVLRIADLPEAQYGEEREGTQTTFWAAIHLAAVEKYEPSFPPPIPIAGKRMLVFDRNQTWRTVLREFCYQWRCGFGEAANTGEVVQMLRQAKVVGVKYDFLLLDSQADEVVGTDFVRALREEFGSEPKIVVLASKARPGDARLLQEAGCNGYLTKPVHRKRLYDTLCLVLAAGGAKELVTRHVVAEEQKLRRAILVVDDNETNRKVVSSMLTRSGFACVLAESGEEALRLMAAEHFPLVLMDIQMPGLNGFQTLAVIRDHASAVLDHLVPVIALTANVTTGERGKYLSAGFQDILEKPFDLKLLIKHVQTYLDTSNPEGEPLALDLEQLLRQLDSDRELMRDVLETFVREGQTRVHEYASAVQAADYPVAEQKAHALRGMAGNIRAGRVFLRAEMAEQACTRQNREKCLQLSQEMSLELGRVATMVADF